MTDNDPARIEPLPRGFMVDMRKLFAWFSNLARPHLITLCTRCRKPAGFWVMRKNAKTVRRPFCLNCTLDFIPSTVVVHHFDGAQPYRRRNG